MSPTTLDDRVPERTPTGATPTSADASAAARLRVALPKGRMEDGILTLLADAGLPVRGGPRGYRPTIEGGSFETKRLKPRGVLELLAAGTRDVGFAGGDWVAELGIEDRVVRVLETPLDPVRVVAAAPPDLDLDGPRETPLRVASEYAGLAARWIAARGIDATVVRTFGATEVYPPEDADLIIDNTATGSTLRANGLVIVDEVMRSSTGLYASQAALDDPDRAAAIDDLRLLLASVLEARTRVLLECNVAPDRLDAVVGTLPAMHRPTIARLHDDDGFAVKAAVERRALPELMPRIRAAGGFDIVVTAPSQIVP